MSGLRTCSSCRTSPSAIVLVVSARIRITSSWSSSTISWKLREYRKSPTSTRAALPQTALAVLRPRRRSDSSTTSSWSRVAVWMNSITAASWCASGAAMAQCAGGEQQQHRPQALAARADDVFGDLVDQHHVRGQALADQRIHGGHVGRGQGLDRRQVGVAVSMEMRGCRAWAEGFSGRRIIGCAPCSAETGQFPTPSRGGTRWRWRGGYNSMLLVRSGRQECEE